MKVENTEASGDSTTNGAASARSEKTADKEAERAPASAKVDAAREPVQGDEFGVRARAAAASAEAKSRTTPFSRSRILRTLYWFLWFIVVPVILACLLIWALTPPSGVEHPGVWGSIEGVVREQPVPIGIVVFTLFEMAFWAARHQLPLSRHAHPPLRVDLPQSMRGPFERARALLDEADVILLKQEKAVVRDLTVKEREKLRADLDGLRTAMDKSPFVEDEFIDALVKADGEVDIRLGRWRKSEVREYVEAILMATLVAFGLRAFVVEAFKIPSGSMIPTLMVGDHIFVNKFSYGPAIPWTHTRLWSSMPPKRGDVIVFAYPESPQQDFIKRVIALPGDKLESRNGHPIINGEEVKSCLVGPYDYFDADPTPLHHQGDLYVEYLEDEAFLTFYDHTTITQEYYGPYYAQPGEVWVMGDNRNNSHDSRMWFQSKGGGVPFENIRGRALFVWLSYAEKMDWSRLGAPVMGRPRLPPSFKDKLQEPLEKCLRNRPAVTRPPPPQGAEPPK